MGVQDLLGWIKKAHPTALVSFPKRWASPEIRGKRIAIDATLITNRYHFAITDGPLKGKGGLVGWYNLISLMRAHNVQPVAIWDKPGIREWKAVETRRRLATRLQASARRQHEHERQDRLVDLREGLVALQELSDEEQEVVRRAWQRGNIASTEIVSSTETIRQQMADIREATEPSHTSTDTLSSEDPSIEESIERITTMEETLRSLVGRYRASIPTPTDPKPDPNAIDDVVEHIAEMEALSESVDAAAEAAERDDAERTRERMAAREFVDEQVGELLPAAGLRETKRQNELTLEEGRIIEEFLKPRVMIDSPNQVSIDTSSNAFPISSIPESQIEDVLPFPTQLEPLDRLDLLSEAALASSDTLPTPPVSESQIEDVMPFPAQLEPLARLDLLIEAAPIVRDTYERALFQPTVETHADCRDLSGRLGIPIIMAEAPYEAEGLATSLALEGVVDWVGTEDSDVIALGGPLLKNVTTANHPLIAIPSSPLLALTSLTREQFIDFCILLGNDACPRIRGVGPKNAEKLIRRHGSIETILDNEPKVMEKVPDLEEYMELVYIARDVFGELPPITEEVKVELKGIFEGMKSQEVDLEGVERWLEDRHGIRFVSADQDVDEI